MTADRKAWGIKLCGHDFDLEYWRDILKEPFDPAVVQHGDDFTLRAREFQSCDSAPAVLEKAIPLFGVLNGAMRFCSTRAASILPSRPPKSAAAEDERLGSGASDCSTVRTDSGSAAV
jgi:hypothetical protein